MTDYNKEFNEVIDLLKTIPNVTEHLNSLQVVLGKEILKRRTELRWEQAKLVENCNSKGVPLTKSLLSRMELGDQTIEPEIYQNVIIVLNQ